MYRHDSRGRWGRGARARAGRVRAGRGGRICSRAAGRARPATCPLPSPAGGRGRRVARAQLRPARARGSPSDPDDSPRRPVRRASRPDATNRAGSPPARAGPRRSRRDHRGVARARAGLRGAGRARTGSIRGLPGRACSGTRGRRRSRSPARMRRSPRCASAETPSGKRNCSATGEGCSRSVARRSRPSGIWSAPASCSLNLVRHRPRSRRRPSLRGTRSSGAICPSVWPGSTRSTLAMSRRGSPPTLAATCAGTATAHLRSEALQALGDAQSHEGALGARRPRWPPGSDPADAAGRRRDRGRGPSRCKPSDRLPPRDATCTAPAPPSSRSRRRSRPAPCAHRGCAQAAGPPDPRRRRLAGRRGEPS